MKSRGSSQGENEVTGNTRIAVLGANVRDRLAHSAKGRVRVRQQELITTLSLVNATLLCRDAS